MPHRRLFIILALLAALAALPALSAPPAAALDRIQISPDKKGFILVPSNRPFHPWGFNYGHHGKLMEDFWDKDFKPIEEDFREVKTMRGNVIRIHLQFSKFMSAPDKPNEQALKQLTRMLKLAEETGLYLDITGLACYRTKDVPKWYDAMDEATRWKTQAKFWEIIAQTCAGSPAVFCYDLINEPIIAGGKRKAGDWYSGKPLGDYDFVQFLSLDPAGRKREEMSAQWIAQLSAAIRAKDKSHLITVGLLPWIPKWGFLSGFIPEKSTADLDFISVHIYPEKGKVDEAITMLKLFAVGKPVVIEETFPLACGADELEDFLLKSKGIATGWIGHYDGFTTKELEQLQADKKITMPQGIWLSWLKLFEKMTPKMLED